MPTVDILTILNEPTIGSLKPREMVDVYLLEQYLKPVYNPQKEVLAMVVGVSTVSEAKIIKEFHKKFYSIDDIKIVGCTIYPDDAVRGREDFNILYTGEFGNAANNDLWLAPKKLSSQEGYDLVSIRHPDLSDIKKWEEVYFNGVSNLKKDGVLITFLTSEDVERYKTLSKNLKKRGCNLILETNTNLTFNNSDHGQLQYIEIFKKD